MGPRYHPMEGGSVCPTSSASPSHPVAAPGAISSRPTWPDVVEALSESADPAYTPRRGEVHPSRVEVQPATEFADGLQGTPPPFAAAPHPPAPAPSASLDRGEDPFSAGSLADRADGMLFGDRDRPRAPSAEGAAGAATSFLLIDARAAIFDLRRTHEDVRLSLCGVGARPPPLPIPRATTTIAPACVLAVVTGHSAAVSIITAHVLATSTPCDTLPERRLAVAATICMPIHCGSDHTTHSTCTNTFSGEYPMPWRLQIRA